jgi:hypothetical protein
MTRSSRIVLAGLLIIGLWHGVAAAQQRIMLVGTVQWTSSNRIQLILDTGASVSIDVSRVDQSSYLTLRGGDRVRVVGYVSPDRNRVIAESVEVGDAGAGGFPQTP